MKAIQIVVDQELLARVDRSARRLKASRSAAVRRLLELGLEQEALTSLARAEARAYARKPVSREERDALASLERSQNRVLDELARTDRW
jgi:metal-responsive CopG/Arc/MetJ family transcriptional regulator